MNIVTYTGTLEPGVLIADGTNPWVETEGVPVNWTIVDDLERQPCPCGEMGDVVHPGVLEAMDTPEGIQRCDACNTYPGDLEAALVLAQMVDGTVKFYREDD